MTDPITLTDAELLPIETAALVYAQIGKVPTLRAEVTNLVAARLAVAEAKATRHYAAFCGAEAENARLRAQVARVEALAEVLKTERPSSSAWRGAY